jgi:glycosyltransferase involved in cell wall biosynthesis
VVPSIRKERRLIRVAFTLITGKSWTGGYNYLLNLVRVLAEHAHDRVQPVLFVGTDAVEAAVAPFAAATGVQVIRTAEFDESRRSGRLREALLIGRDRAAAHCFRRHKIDVAFEYTQFYGWRFPIPTIAWLTDFQHRHLREMFSLGAYWKRELGFRAQVLSGRYIMLSSEDSRRDCEIFLPRSTGRNSVVHFAVPPPDLSDYNSVCTIAETYELPDHFFYLPNQFWKHKNHRIVIEALLLLKERGHNIVVAATGEPVDFRHPEHYRALQSLVDSYGMAQNFRFLGLVPREHVFALMRAATAMINPSLSEGWSTTVEEAKSLGVPLLLSNLSVHVEQAGDCARYFNPRAAEQLALLMGQHEGLSGSSRRNVEVLAVAASQNRVKQFAIDFSDTVAHAVWQGGLGAR